MEKLRKFTTRLLSVTLAAVMSLFAGISASAKPAYQWGVDRSAPNPEDHYGWIGNGSTKFSIDDKVHTDNSWYSIKLDNTDYNDAFVEKTYNVEPNTTYKFSAMVKHSGFQAAPDAPEFKAGAYLAPASYYIHEEKVVMVPISGSAHTASSEWTLLEYEFTTGNEITYGLRLGNEKCKGTAYFCDVKLEKAEMTNSWNVLAVYFKNVDATVTLNGKTVHHKMSLTEDEMEEMNEFALDTLPENLRALSNNKMTINLIDRYYSDEMLTEEDFGQYNNEEFNIHGYLVDKNSPVLCKTLDKYLAQKHYNQIIVFVPLNGIDGGWWGLTGVYKNVTFTQIKNTWKGAIEKSGFPGYVTAHEMCHGLERRSQKIYGNKTPEFHDILYKYTTQYPNSTEPSYYEMIHQFLNCTLPDGRGVDPSVFNVTSGKYTLVSDDMTTGKGIEQSSSSVTPPAPKNFIIKSETDDTVTVTWDAVPKASGYQMVLFKNADFKEIWATYDYKSDRTSTALGPITKGKPYYYGVRTVASINGKTVYSDWTTLTYTHMGVGVIRGDIDNNGVFNINDVAAAVSYFFSGEKIDKRTADAVAISGRDNINVQDIATLVDWFLKS